MAHHWINLCCPVLVILIALNGVTSHPEGAPEEACDDMIPKHHTFLPSSRPRPFTISVSSEKFILGEPVNG